MSTIGSAPRGVGRMGILWRGDPRAEQPAPEPTRLRGVFEALAERGIVAEPVLYADDVVREVREQLLRLAGVLVWVNPIEGGHDRATLDAMLRDVASRGVWVSAHPDVILKMGTKDVLVRTRDMEWGSDCHLYRTLEELREQLPSRLAAGPRVLKQHRGNGGNGVWRVQLGQATWPATDAIVSVLHAQRGSRVEKMRFADFVSRCAGYFAGSGCMVDQPFQDRLGDGMIRCYLVRDRVAGFGYQLVKALLPSANPDATPPLRLYYGPDKPEFQALKARLESRRVAEMQRRLDVGVDSLPAIWDVDFLYGPKMESGDDTYVLCEINVSSVFPFPDEANAPLADAVVRMLTAGRAASP